VKLRTYRDRIVIEVPTKKALINKSDLVDQIIDNLLDGEKGSLALDLSSVDPSTAERKMGDLVLPSDRSTVEKTYELREAWIKKELRGWLTLQEKEVLAVLLAYSNGIEEVVRGLGQKVGEAHSAFHPQKVQLEMIEEMNDLEPGQGHRSLMAGKKMKPDEEMPKLKIQPPIAEA